MAGEFVRLAPEGFAKIAQNDNMSGEVLSVVYYNNLKKQFFIQTMGANNAYTTLGPMAAHIFNNLAAVISDVRSMEGRYYPLD